MTEQDWFGEVEFANNPSQRSACLVLIDASDSMCQIWPGEQRSPLDELSGGLDTLIASIRKDPLAKARVELSFLMFGTTPAEPTPFATVDDVVLPHLIPMGITNSAEAIQVGLDHLENRKQDYKRNGIPYTRPMVIFLTDGLSTSSKEDMAAASSRIKEMEAGKKLSFFAIGVGNGTDKAELDSLGTRESVSLRGMSFGPLFEWLSASMSSVSASSPEADRVPLPSPAGWAEF